MIGSKSVNIQVLGSNGGRKSGKSDKLVLHFECVVDAVYVEEVDDRLRKIMRRSTRTMNESLGAKIAKR